MHDIIICFDWLVFPTQVEKANEEENKNIIRKLIENVTFDYEEVLWAQLDDWISLSFLRINIQIGKTDAMLTSEESVRKTGPRASLFWL